MSLDNFILDQDADDTGTYFIDTILIEPYKVIDSLGDGITPDVQNIETQNSQLSQKWIFVSI